MLLARSELEAGGLLDLLHSCMGHEAGDSYSPINIYSIDVRSQQAIRR